MAVEYSHVVLRQDAEWLQKAWFSHVLIDFWTVLKPPCR
jgi:hypothetical protein